MQNFKKNKVIIKNTLVLYMRMIVVTIISLFTSRVIIQSLGIVDFGIYNIASVLITLLGLISGSMSTATQRFLNIKLGLNDLKGLFKILNISVSIHILLSSIIFLLGETIGLWFFYYKLNIPYSRINAALWVYQFSLLTILLSIIRIPYLSIIIAFEKMTFFAYIGIIEVVLKLVIAYLILINSGDRLILYAIYLFVVSVILQFLCYIYCKLNIRIPNFKLYSFRNKEYKDLFAFSGWSFTGYVVNAGSNQVMNVILNITWGVTLNAAMGIVNQISGVISNLITNVLTAVRPQSVQLFASNETQEMNQLISRTSKISFFLILILAFPLLLNCEYILRLWLTQIPAYTVIFVQFIIIHFLCDSIFQPLSICIEASGKIKGYNIIQSIFLILLIIFSYYIILYTHSPIYAMGIKIILGIIMISLIRLHYSFTCGKINKTIFLKTAIQPILRVLMIILPFYILLNLIHNQLDKLLLSLLVTSTFLLSIIYYWGLSKDERNFVYSHFKQIISVQR